MLVSFFIEIDADGNPRYKDEFIKDIERSKKNGGWVVAPKEYSVLVEEAGKVFYEIPENIVEHLSKPLEHKCDRDILLLIQRNYELEDWLGNLLNELGNVEVMKAYGEYVSLIKVANQKNIEMYCEVGKKDGDIETGMQKVIASTQHQIQVYEEENKSLKENVHGLKEYITSTEKYVKELQIHATNLDNELKYYKSCDKDNVELLRKERDRYYKLYKENLEKLNETETAYLELKEKQNKHR